MDNDDILDGLDDILGAAEHPDAPAPSPAPRTRRTKAQMAAAAAQAATTMGAVAAVAVTAAEMEAARPVARQTPPAPPIDPMAAQHGFSGRKLKIIVDKGHGKDDPTSVFLRLNNYEATVQRGVPVELYEEVIAACLDCAVQTVFAQPAEGVLIPHESLRFSYRVVR